MRAAVLLCLSALWVAAPALGAAPEEAALLSADDLHTKSIVDSLAHHPDHVKTVNGKVVTDDEFHSHAIKHIGPDYSEDLQHIHTTYMTGDELKAALDAKHPDDELFTDDDDDHLNPAAVRRQLREQGVREANLERLTQEIMQAHKEERVSTHRTHHGSKDTGINRMEGFRPMVPESVVKSEFRKIDTDTDGRVFIAEVKSHFEKQLSELEHSTVHKMLHDSHYSHDTSDENIKKVHDELKAHYEEQLAGLDTVWAGSDINKDGYISYPEYERFVQEAHWLAHQEAAAKKLLGEDMHLFDENWREEL